MHLCERVVDCGCVDIMLLLCWVLRAVIWIMLVLFRTWRRIEGLCIRQSCDFEEMNWLSMRLKFPFYCISYVHKCNEAKPSMRLKSQCNCS